jgi:hypothetical protein
LGVVRPAELARRAQLAPLAGLIEQFLQASLGEMKLTGGAPPVSLESIDSIAYALVLPTGPWAQQGQAANEANSDMICEVAVRFVEEVDALAWVVEHVPDAARMQDGPLRYVRVPIEGGNIDATYLALLDAHTVAATYKLERLREIVTATGDDELADQWASVDGGLATLAFQPERLADRDVTVGQELAEAAQAMLGGGVAEGQPNPLEMAIQTIGDGTGIVCLGLDLDPATGDVVVRTALACPDYAMAKKVRESFEPLQAFVKEYARVMGVAAMPQGLDVFTQMYFDSMLTAARMFGEAEIDFRLRAEDAVDVWFEARGPLPASIQQGLAGLAAEGDALVRPAAAEAPVEAPADAVPK